MKKVFTLALSFLLIFSVSIPASAVSARATNRVDATIPANSLVGIGTPLPMEIDELITINCTYSPRTADVDFGLITPQNTFRYLSGEDGLCRQTIRINETGNYNFAVRNNTNRTVDVLGYVYY